MATSYDIQRRRQEFYSYSFDEIIAKVIDAEEELGEARDEIRDLEAELAEAMGDAE